MSDAEKLPDDLETSNRWMITAHLSRIVSPLLFQRTPHGIAPFSANLQEATLLAAWLIVMAGVELHDDKAIDDRVRLLVDAIRKG